MVTAAGLRSLKNDERSTEGRKGDNPRLVRPTRSLLGGDFGCMHSKFGSGSSGAQAEVAEDGYGITRAPGRWGLYTNAMGFGDHSSLRSSTKDYDTRGD